MISKHFIEGFKSVFVPLWVYIVTPIGLLWSIFCLITQTYTFLHVLINIFGLFLWGLNAAIYSNDFGRRYGSV